MTRPTHFEVEVLYATTFGPACGNGAPGKLTDDPQEVTCKACRELCGFDEGMTECVGDPLNHTRSTCCSGCGCFSDDDCALNYGGHCRWTGGYEVVAEKERRNGTR